MKKCIIASVLAIAAQTAMAADVAVPQDNQVIEASDPQAPASGQPRWAGFSAGVSVGQAFLRDTIPADGDDLTFGAHVGYNKQWGSLVAGLEAAVDNGDVLFTDGSGIKSRFLYSARMKAGLANDWIFAYGSVGAQHGVTNLPKPFSKDTALQLGAGVEVAITQKVSLGLDFTYAKYKKFADFAFFGNTVDVETKVVKARVSYTFN